MQDSSSLSVEAVLQILLTMAVILFVGHKSRLASLDRKSNLCKMTYSRPQYVPLPVRGDVDGESPGYGYRLLRFVDGKLPASDREHPSKPRGTPVLFVPGHQGNFQQVWNSICAKPVFVLIMLWRFNRLFNISLCGASQEDITPSRNIIVVSRGEVLSIATGCCCTFQLTRRININCHIWAVLLISQYAVRSTSDIFP